MVAAKPRANDTGPPIAEVIQHDMTGPSASRRPT